MKNLSPKRKQEALYAFCASQKEGCILCPLYEKVSCTSWLRPIRYDDDTIENIDKVFGMLYDKEIT